VINRGLPIKTFESAKVGDCHFQHACLHSITGRGSRWRSSNCT
jgi:hypothetical protein